MPKKKTNNKKSPINNNNTPLNNNNNNNMNNDENKQMEQVILDTYNKEFQLNTFNNTKLLKNNKHELINHLIQMRNNIMLDYKKSNSLYKEIIHKDIDEDLLKDFNYKLKALYGEIIYNDYLKEIEDIENV